MSSAPAPPVFMIYIYTSYPGLHMIYSEDSINGTPFVQCLVSHLRKNPTHKSYVVWYCECWFHQDRPSHLHKNPIYIPSHLLDPHCIYTSYRDACTQLQRSLNACPKLVEFSTRADHDCQTCITTAVVDEQRVRLECMLADTQICFLA